MLVDIAVVAYRRWDLTRSCLNHLARQTREHRLVVCDNGCNEGTAERVRAEFPAVHVVRLERNMPYPVACNTAAAAGSGDALIMMNNDVDAREDFVERLVAPLEHDARIGSVAALLLRPGETAIDSAGLVADRTLATEAIVVAGDAVLERDTVALRGRVAGWRAAGRRPSQRLPAAGVDDGISFVRSLRLRRGDVSGRAVT